jgi:hypothetical protein
MRSGLHGKANFKSVARASVAGLALTLLLSACVEDEAADDTDGAGDDDIAVAPEPTPSPTPTPTPSPTPTTPPVIVGEPDENGVVQLDPIRTNFDAAGLLTDRKLAPSGEPDVVGAFRFLCEPSHNLYDDPVVFPGQPGRSHLHTFFGNTEANAHSDYRSLRTIGESTCRNALNRSSYWIPAMLNGAGGVVMPKYIIIYYKRHPADSERCQREKACLPLPRGLRYVFGNTMRGAVGTNRVQISCSNPNGKQSASHDNIPDAARECGDGGTLLVSTSAPQCWNGKDLDSADHRSHMAYQTAGPETNYKTQCPETHPYYIPKFTIKAAYSIDPTLDRSGDRSTSRPTWHFASDRQEGFTRQLAGTTFHADWFGAWDDEVLADWTRNCIDKLLSCNDGDLGDGRGMRNVNPGRSGVSATVPVPPRPTA